MNLSLIRPMTRSAVFELENGLCFRPAHPFVVTLNGKTVYEACNTNVFSLFSLLPDTEYTVGVQAEGETLSLTFVTEAESFFVDASRYGLVADGVSLKPRTTGVLTQRGKAGNSRTILSRFSSIRLLSIWVNARCWRLSRCLRSKISKSQCRRAVLFSGASRSNQPQVSIAVCSPF